MYKRQVEDRVDPLCGEYGLYAVLDFRTVEFCLKFGAYGFAGVIGEDSVRPSFIADGLDEGSCMPTAEMTLPVRLSVDAW